MKKDLSNDPFKAVKISKCLRFLRRKNVIRPITAGCIDLNKKKENSSHMKEVLQIMMKQ